MRVNILHTLKILGVLWRFKCQMCDPWPPCPGSTWRQLSWSRCRAGRAAWPRSTTCRSRRRRWGRSSWSPATPPAPATASAAAAAKVRARRPARSCGGRRARRWAWGSWWAPSWCAGCPSSSGCRWSPSWWVLSSCRQDQDFRYVIFNMPIM